MRKLRDLFFNPVSWKLLVIGLGYLLGFGNLFAVPTDYVDFSRFPEEDHTHLSSAVKAAGFTLLVGVALFAGLIPTTTCKASNNEILVDFFARLLGVLATFGAGYYWLDNATFGEPGPYLIGLLILGTAAIAAVLIWGGVTALAILLEKLIVIPGRWAWNRAKPLVNRIRGWLRL